MLTELVDLALTAMVVMWVLFVGLVVYAGWFDRRDLTQEPAEVEHIEADPSYQVLKSA